MIRQQLLIRDIQEKLCASHTVLYCTVLHLLYCTELCADIKYVLYCKYINNSVRNDK